MLGVAPVVYQRLFSRKNHMFNAFNLFAFPCDVYLKQKRIDCLRVPVYSAARELRSEMISGWVG